MQNLANLLMVVSMPLNLAGQALYLIQVARTRQARPTVSVAILVIAGGLCLILNISLRPTGSITALGWLAFMTALASIAWIGAAWHRAGKPGSAEDADSKNSSEDER